MIRVLIKASSDVAKTGLEALVRANPSMYVIERTVSTRQPAPDGSETSPDVVLVEVEDKNDELTHEALEWASNGVAVVLLIHHASHRWIGDMLRDGLKAVLPASTTGPAIIASVEAARAGLIAVHPSDLDILVESDMPTDGISVPAMPEPLTSRETAVLRLVALGLANKEIAARLDISEHTVKFHVASVMGKLGASSRTEAVTLGIRHGIVMI